MKTYSSENIVILNNPGLQYCKYPVLKMLTRVFRKVQAILNNL